MTSQESADSFLASPALVVGGKNKKKRKSEPKGVKMLHQEKVRLRFIHTKRKRITVKVHSHQGVSKLRLRFIHTKRKQIMVKVHSHQV